MASPILRETIKKLRERQALLQKQIKGPLQELRQIEEDLVALGATGPAGRARKPTGDRAPRGANQAAVLRAIRNGATTSTEISEKTNLSTSSVTGTLTNSINKQKLVTRGANGLTLTKRGREKLAELEAE